LTDACAPRLSLVRLAQGDGDRQRRCLTARSACSLTWINEGRRASAVVFDPGLP
jgi:hypothetical protein